jgi:hypothetical protein
MDRPRRTAPLPRGGGVALSLIRGLLTQRMWGETSPPMDHREITNLCGCPGGRNLILAAAPNAGYMPACDVGTNSLTVTQRPPQPGLAGITPIRFGGVRPFPSGRSSASVTRRDSLARSVRQAQRRATCGAGRRSLQGRNVVERSFALAKQWRALATGYDKLAITYRAAVVLSACIIWTRL